MQLKSVHVSNFRSVEDSGEFEVETVTCLVGKNEAGKSAILQALAALNPHPSTRHVLDVERDYPRRHLTEYQASLQAGEQHATVIATKWQLTDEEIAEITALIGDSLKGREIIASRRYGDGEVQWEAPVDYVKAAQFLIDEEKPNAAERSAIGHPKNSQELREALKAIAEPTEKHTRILNRLDALPGKSIRHAVENVLKQKLPRFMYFSHYDRMEGQLRLDTFRARAQGQEAPAISQGEHVFVDFLEYAGTSIDEINQAQTYEGLNAKCEAASNRITDQLLEYWTQNPHLEVEVRVTKGEPRDPPPFNTGVIARARVKNNLHKVTVPFSERSAGFIWFFSFLVKFAQVRKDPGELILLLDEPGLTLHGKAQADLLRYFDEKLAPDHQILFSTHSPFMVPADKLPSVRLVEDRLVAKRPGIWTSEGTKVRSDALATDRDTLFPLQGALGYDLTQTLFVGKHTLLVEGPGDILYLQALSSALGRRGRTQLDRRWTICPAGGIDKIQSFVGLFAGAKLDIAALTDYSRADKRKLESLRQMGILDSDRIVTVADILNLDEADIEDIFDTDLFLPVINEAFALPTSQQLDAAKLDATGADQKRLLKRVEAAFALLPPEAPEFNHYTPAEWLFRNPSVLDGDSASVGSTLERAESVIQKVNSMLGRLGLS